MGCNYYGKRILTETEKLKAIEAILKDESYTPVTPTHVHIGKSSIGWRFCFNHHNWDYFKSKEEFISFLKNYKISDQYGTEYLFEDFWDFVMSKDAESTSGSSIHKFGFRFSDSTEFS